MKFILSLILFSYLSFPQTTYYFSTSGDDGNAGTSSGSPKETLSALQTLINSSTPGDSFLLKRGDTWTTRAGTYALELIGVQGTSANPIVVDAYGTGEKPKLNISGTANIIYFSSGNTSIMCYYVEINNLQLVSTAGVGSNPENAIRVGGSGSATTSPHHLTFDNLFVDGTYRAFSWQSVNPYITLSNSTTQNLTGDGGTRGGEAVVGTSRGTVIENCEFINCLNEILYLSGGAGDSTFVRNNIFRDSVHGIALANGDSVFIEGNQFIDIDIIALSASSRADGTGFLFYLTNTFVRRNTFDNCTYGIVLNQSISDVGATGDTYTQVGEIINNKFVNGNTAIRWLDTGANPDPVHYEDYLVANNTIVNHTYGIRFNSGDFTNIEVYNNIFYNETYSSGVLFEASSSHLTDIITDYNLYYNTVGNTFAISGTNYTLSAFQSAFVLDEQNSISANPDFSNPGANIYGLLEGSPAIDVGTNLTGIVDDDLAGLSRPQNLIWDIGAYEFDSESDPPDTIITPTVTINSGGWGGEWGWTEIISVTAVPETTVVIDTFYILQSSDDARRNSSGTINLTDTTSYLGFTSVSNDHGFKFGNIIERDIYDSALVEFTNSGNLGSFSDPDLRIAGENTQNPATFSTGADFLTRKANITTAVNDTTLSEAWVDQTKYRLRVTNSIGELFGSYDYTGTGDIVLFVLDNGSASNDRKTVYMYDSYFADKKPKLIIYSKVVTTAAIEESIEYRIPKFEMGFWEVEPEKYNYITADGQVLQTPEIAGVSQ